MGLWFAWRGFAIVGWFSMGVKTVIRIGWIDIGEDEVGDMGEEGHPGEPFILPYGDSGVKWVDAKYVQCMCMSTCNPNFEPGSEIRDRQYYLSHSIHQYIAVGTFILFIHIWADTLVAILSCFRGITYVLWN